MRKNKRKKYSAKEKRAYWIGVGISAERHGDGEKMLGHRNSKYKNSAINGYNADNHRDIVGRF